MLSEQPLRNLNLQKGAIPILVLIAAVGVIAVLAISSIAPFRDGIFYALFPKDASQAAIDEWTQDGHDGQRTGSTSEEPVTPWTFQWSFNGPDANGGTANHQYDAPKEARVVTGGAHIYVPAGSRGLYALRKTNGTVAWNVTNTSFNATPAYDPATQTVIAGGADGQVYKINASTGSILGTFNTGSPINKSVLLNGGYAYIVSDNGNLNKVAISNVSPAWTYAAGSTVATLPAYSYSRDSIIYATDDLYIHSVNNSNGTRKWRVKPTPNLPGGETATNIPQTYGGVKTGNQFELGWPVIAEKSGIVFVRMQLVLQAHFEGPNGGRFANTNAENRAWLVQNPQYKNLFALNLDNGTEKFIPAVGYGSTEDWINDPAAYGVMGSQPAVKLLPDGKEVAYIHFRSNQTSPATDFRWSGHMGEMVLDDSTIPGLAAGDLRFVKMSKYQDAPGKGNCDTHIIDEQTPLTIAGNILINAHWANSCSAKITDRSNSRGLTASDPIATTPLPPIIRAQRGSCADKNTTTHYTTCSAQYLTDGGSTGEGRYYGGPGFWGYWNVADPPGWRIGSGNSAGTSYSAGFLPRHTIVSDGQMIVEGNGGEILVFKYSGTVASAPPSPAASPSPSPSIVASPSPIKPGDLDGNSKVDIFDYNILLTNFGKAGAGVQGDLDGNNKVDIFDYNNLLTNFGM